MNSLVTHLAREENSPPAGVTWEIIPAECDAYGVEETEAEMIVTFAGHALAALQKFMAILEDHGDHAHSLICYLNPEGQEAFAEARMVGDRLACSRGMITIDPKKTAAELERRISSAQRVLRGLEVK